MNELVLYTGTVFMGFFAIMNPLANTPVFLGLTSQDDPQTRRAVARNALVLAFLIVVVFTVAGKLIRYIGENAVNAVTRLMGLILAVIGTQMLIKGVHGAIQSYK
jgi:multiple antibiotic resistance protein